MFVILPDGKYKEMPAHRFSWELHNGPLPAELFALHHCDTPPCIRPSHLFKGTALDNMLDKTAKRRNGACAPKHPARGSSASHSRLTEKEVIRIKQMYASGRFTQQCIADKFGVNQTSISAIIVGKNWKHLPKAS
jgi:hypothetical protein